VEEGDVPQWVVDEAAAIGSGDGAEGGSDGLAGAENPEALPQQLPPEPEAEEVGVEVPVDAAGATGEWDEGAQQGSPVPSPTGVDHDDTAAAAGEDESGGGDFYQPSFEQPDYQIVDGGGHEEGEAAEGLLDVGPRAQAGGEGDAPTDTEL
jgi:hypothetical protein